MKRTGFLLLAGLLFVGGARADDGVLWLQRMNQAARNLSFSGVFVYQTQGRTETSRIVRLVDGAGEHERLETLDGTPREVVRNNESVECYLPADKMLVLDRAIMARQPGRLISKPATLSEIYTIRLGESGRVAGRETQMLLLEPRDEMRYGHQLWIDTATGLLLKARMMADPANMLEQFAFTEMQPAAVIEHERLKPRSNPAGWRVVNAAGEEVLPEDIPWVFRRLPPGFKPVSLLKRSLRKGEPAIHVSFSDGFANVSVFIEAFHPDAQPHTVPPVGPVGMYRRVLGEYQLTVLGEVPAIALRRIAEGVERRK